MHVSLIQLDVSATEAIPDRITRTMELVAEASRDTDLVVLPELWHVGAFDVEGARANAEPIDGPLVSLMSRAAATHGVWMHGGSFAERGADGRHFNTSVLFAPDGRLVSTYRKIHLFGFTGGETTLMSAGEEVVVVETPLGLTGLATCYDLRFPELYRRFVDAGAVAVIMGSGWPTPRISHWSTLVRARAIENQMVVMACNEVGTHAGTVLGGHSVVVDATGEVLAEAGGGEEILRAQVDIERVLQWRERFPVLGDRRL